MFGKELYIIYQEKINFGLNMHIWNKYQDSLINQERYLEGGWSGYLDKKLGWLI